MCYKGEETIEYDLISEEETTDKNGLKFEMNINGYYEYSQFKEKAKQRLTYYDTVVLIIDGDVIENKVYRNDLFQFADNQPFREMHLCLKDVVYEINWGKLGIRAIHIPIALRFTLDEGLTPNPSREMILMNNQSIKLIKDKIALVADYFINKFNEQTQSFDNILDAWDFIGVKEKYVELEGEQFDCQDLEEYSKFTFNKVKVKGVELQEPNYYKKLKYELVGEYIPVAYDRQGSWKKKYIQNEFANSLRDSYTNAVQFDGNLAGRVKTFLRDKYDVNNTVYVNRSNIYDLRKYRAILYLKKDEKEKWRGLIKEFQEVLRQVIEKKVVNETRVEETEEYIEWLEKYRAEAREKRKKTVQSGEYKGLNKQEGEITIGKLRTYKRGTGTCVSKSTRRIKDLNKNKGLWVYIEKDFLTGQEQYDYLMAFSNVTFVELNKREIKFVEKLNTWMSMEKFKESKPFIRLATALEIENVLEMAPDNEEIIYEAFPKYQELKDTLKEYKGQNYNGGVSNTVRKMFMDYAKENNLYDQNIWYKVLEFKKLMKDFSFLKYLDIDNFDDLEDEERKIIKNILFVMLKNRKISCRFVEEYELVEKVPLEVEILMAEQELEAA